MFTEPEQSSMAACLLKLAAPGDRGEAQGWVARLFGMLKGVSFAPGTSHGPRTGVKAFLNARHTAHTHTQTDFSTERKEVRNRLFDVFVLADFTAQALWVLTHLQSQLSAEAPSGIVDARQHQRPWGMFP